MRLVHLRVQGYKRLADASCNLDGRLIALLGPNEAGKSSVLEALAWLSDDEEEEPLEGAKRSRTLGALADTHPVVQTRFALEPDDVAVLHGLDVHQMPRMYVLHKLADGTYRTNCEPELQRRRGPLDLALRKINAFESKQEPLVTADVRLWLQAIRASLEATDDSKRPACADAITYLREWCEVTSGDQSLSKKSADAVRGLDALLVDIAKVLQTEAPSSIARARLRKRVPEFLLFSESDRELRTEYNLNDASVVSNVPDALTNLLALGDTNFAEVRRVHASRDITRINTYLKRVNKRLAERVQPTWRQATLSVSLNLDGLMLQVLIDEATGATTAIAERSDGLKSFIALVCFLARHHGDVPPILMIDEAETHLHYDAQADLIDVLLNHVETSKVIYTTHSPGCLPPDLGTGIRLVAPTAGRASSKLRNDFWSSNEPGFSPLLFAMGAGAAAFSVCRRAVLAEGPSDMILLPTLLRLATKAQDVGYQVAPGLSSAPATDLTNEAVAAKVAYLVDGDKAGNDYRADLVAAGVDKQRIFSLPPGDAIEDLLTPACYLSAVTGLMADAGHTGTRVTIEALTGDGPIAGRLGDWCKAYKAPLPGKTAVASRLVQRPADITLTTDGARALKALHKAISRVLS